MSAAAPTISIVIPAYNVERYVAAAIDSALAQTYPHVEVVVVDDGATDATADIVAGYGERVVFVRQANRGLAGARNTALAHASGEYIGLLDADDIWEPERAARVAEYFAARPQTRIVTTDAWIIDEDALTTRRYYPDHLARAFPAPAEQIATIARHNFVFVAAVVHRDVFARIGGFDEALRRAEDYDLWCRALLAGEHIGLIDEPLARYRVRADSLSANRAAQWAAHLDVLAKHADALLAAGVRLDATTAYDLARRAETAGDRRLAARRYVGAAAGQDPGRRLKLVAAAVRAVLRPRRW